jgi:hypothetical protein
MRFVSTWQADYIQVYTGGDFGSEAKTWQANTIRKIETLKRAFHELPEEITHFAWMDIDCVMKSRINEVYYMNADICATRMMKRDNRGGGDANAGVIFFKRSNNTLNFIETWLNRAIKNEGTRRLFEQKAFSDLCFEGFDGLRPWSVVPVSEHIYNCEDDDDSAWFAKIEKYKPKIIHLKAGRWKSESIVKRILSV